MRATATSTATLGTSAGPASVAGIVVQTTGGISKITDRATALVATLSDEQIKGVHTFWATERGVPPEFDGKLLGKCRDELGRDLALKERREARNAFGTAVKAKGTRLSLDFRLRHYPPATGLPMVMWHSKMPESNDFEPFDYWKFERFMKHAQALLTFLDLKNLANDAIEDQKRSNGLPAKGS